MTVKAPEAIEITPDKFDSLAPYELTDHQDPEGMVEIRFKPKSCWRVFADMAGHPCLAGEFAMINTFMVPRENFRYQEFSPWEVLSRYAAGKSALPPEIPIGT